MILINYFVKFIHWLFPKSKKEVITENNIIIGLVIWVVIMVIVVGFIY